VRAELIASTEVTRVFTQATLLAEANNPYTVAYRFQTSADERVCPICSPLNQQVTPKNSSGFGDLGCLLFLRPSIFRLMGICRFKPKNAACYC
jgi:hypothetical protein